MAKQFDYEKFANWQNETHIPDHIMKMVDIVCEQLGIYVSETTIEHRSIYGVLIGFSKGFRLSHCTSSYADGPSADMTPVFMKWLGGLDFHVENSYGDNGLDYSTNWHDTYWHNEISYSPSMVYDDQFWIYDDDDEYDD